MIFEVHMGSTCCFTGHRKTESRSVSYDDTVLTNPALAAAIEKCAVYLYEKRGVRTFITGMALGTDLLAAEVVLGMKKTRPDVELVGAIPCADQSARWTEPARRRYEAIRARLDNSCVFQDVYTRDCMDKRNRFMADNSEYVIAVWNGTKGGTCQTVRYARKLKRGIFIINPDTLEIKTEFPAPKSEPDAN